MRKYYYSDGIDRKGPFTLSELKLVKGVSAETKVWYQGIAEWTRAGDIPELSGVFTSVPPPLPGVSSPSQPPPLPGVIPPLPKVAPPPLPPQVKQPHVPSSKRSTTNESEMGGSAINNITSFIRSLSNTKRSYLFAGLSLLSVILLSGLVYYFVGGKDTKENISLPGIVTDSQSVAEKPTEKPSLPASVTGTYSGGAGTKERPYLISSRSDMEALSINVNNGNRYEDSCFLLTRNLTGAEDVVTTVIGEGENRSTEYKCFHGIFDGGGHSIAVNIDIRGDGEQYGGIFGTTRNATIKNLSVSGRVSVTSTGRRILNPGYIEAYAYAGGIVGDYQSAVMSEENRKIINCYNSAEIVAESKSETYAGGIAGNFIDDADNGNAADDGIRNCHNSGKVSAIGGSWTYAGGIAGQFLGGKISDCHNSGKVSIAGGCAGGIAGTFASPSRGYDGGYMIKCTNSGEIFAGGPGRIIGYTEQITTAYIGGIVGHDENHMVSDYYHNSNSGVLIDLSSVRSD